MRNYLISQNFFKGVNNELSTSDEDEIDSLIVVKIKENLNNLKSYFEKISQSKFIIIVSLIILNKKIKKSLIHQKGKIFNPQYLIDPVLYIPYDLKKV